MKKIALIPAYEPDEKLIILLQELSKHNFIIVVVDDGSGKNYKNIFEEAKKYANVISYEVNCGKGFALKTGLKMIKENFNSYAVVTVDSDGQHKVLDAENLINFAIEHRDIFVLGMRKRVGKIPIRSRLGNAITRFIYRISTGLDVYDTQTGLRAFSEDFVDDLINIQGNRYEYEMNVLLEFARRNIKMKEIEIKTIYIQNNKGSHFNFLKDSFRIYKEILKFSLSSITSFVIDYVLYSLFITSFNNLILSNILARLISSTYNFFVNKIVVFKSSKNTFKSYIEYFALVIFILILNTILLDLFTNNLGINKYLSKILVELILFIFNWIIQRKIIFKNKI